MRRTPLDHTMLLRAPALAMLCAIAVGGCVSTETHTKALTELEAAKKTSAELQQQLAELQQNLDQEASQRKAAEQQAAELAKEREALAARSNTRKNSKRRFARSNRSSRAEVPRRVKKSPSYRNRRLSLKPTPLAPQRNVSNFGRNNHNLQRR